MSLGCLACHAMEGSTNSFRLEESMETRSLSSRSDDGGACLTGCFARRPAQHTSTEQSHVQSSRVAPVSDVDQSPRLTRCYAVRRDCSFFRDWSVSEVETATLVGQVGVVTVVGDTLVASSPYIQHVHISFREVAVTMLCLCPQIMSVSFQWVWLGNFMGGDIVLWSSIRCALGVSHCK